METKKYFAKKGLSAAKAKTMLKDDSAQGHKLTKKQRAYFGYIAGGGKPKAADGMINANAGTPQQAQGQPQGQPAQNPQPQGLSVIVTMVVNAPDGSQQPIGTVTIQKPDDLKEVIQKVIQVFQQGQQQAQPEGGQPEGQPAQPQQPTQ
jgi:hypothetical protein